MTEQSSARQRSIAHLSDLTGRTAVVTGGEGHLGRAITSTLAELGADVIAIDLPSAMRPRHSPKEPMRGSVRPLAIDLAARDGVQAVADEVDSVDILVHAAALVGGNPLPGWETALEAQSADTFSLALDVNLRVPFSLTQALAPRLAQHARGSVIMVSSIYGVVGPDMRLYEGTEMGNPAAYTASKAGMLGIVRWLATVLAPAVRVNAISPGGVLRQQPPAFVDRYQARVPLGRMATEEDIKGATAFLASDLSAYVTGQNIIVDGGFTAW